jgi:hypothetical protein
MKTKLLVLFALAAVVLVAILLHKRRRKLPSVIYRLVWFELQVAPSSYRFAIMPEQPILIMFEGENGQEGAVMLIRYDHAPEAYEQTVERVDSIVKRSGVLNLRPLNPDQAFEDAAMESPSVHIRLAYADNTRWAGVYDMDNVPEAVSGLIHDTKSLAGQIMQEQSKEKINGDVARTYLEPEKNIAQAESIPIIVKVKVYQSGKISANGQEVTLGELAQILDDVKQKNGVVWYFRESPDKEPSEALDKIIKGVLDAIMGRDLPLRLQPTEY